MKQINMTCLVDMPENLFEQSDVALKVKPAWDAFLKAIEAAGVNYSVNLDVMVAEGPRKRSGKPAPKQPNVLPVAEDTAGDRMLHSVRAARAFARGETNEGFIVHDPDANSQ